MIVRDTQRNLVLENQSGQGKVKRFVAIAEKGWYYTGLAHSVFEAAKPFQSWIQHGFASGGSSGLS